jgi:K+-transporting ATPase A subunit
MANKKNTLQVVVGSILILLLIGVTVLLISEKRANNELVQEFNLEKEDLENQYTDFAKSVGAIFIPAKIIAPLLKYKNTSRKDS